MLDDKALVVAANKGIAEGLGLFGLFQRWAFFVLGVVIVVIMVVVFQLVVGLVVVVGLLVHHQLFGIVSHVGEVQHVLAVSKVHLVEHLVKNTDGKMQRFVLQMILLGELKEPFHQKGSHVGKEVRLTQHIVSAQQHTTGQITISTRDDRRTNDTSLDVGRGAVKLFDNND